GFLTVLIAAYFPVIRFSKTDQSNRRAAPREDNCMHAAIDLAQGVETTLSIGKPGIFFDQGIGPVERRYGLKLDPMLGAVCLSLSRVPSKLNSLLWLRFGSPARAAPS